MQKSKADVWQKEKRGESCERRQEDLDIRAYKPIYTAYIPRICASGVWRLCGDEVWRAISRPRLYGAM
jgi:hypothetical protein